MVACLRTPFLSILVHILGGTHVFISLGFYLGMGLLGHTVQSFPKASAVCFTSLMTYTLFLILVYFFIFFYFLPSAHNHLNAPPVQGILPIILSPL